MTDITADRVAAMRAGIDQLNGDIDKGLVTYEDVRGDPLTVLGRYGLSTLEIMLVLREDDHYAHLVCEGASLTCLITLPCVRSMQPKPFHIFEPPVDLPSGGSS